MAEQDPTKITLAEAVDLYNAEVGTAKIKRFGPKGKYNKFGSLTVAEAFAGEKGKRPIDVMLTQAAETSPGAYNSLMDDLRLLSIPVARRIRLADANSPILSTFPGAEAGDEQTKTIFGERRGTAESVRIAILSKNKKGIADLFNQLEAIASDPKNPNAAVADAILVSFYTGPRGGLIAGLQGSEYDPDTASIFVQPQTKAQVEAGGETRTGAQKGETGFRGTVIPYRIPLNEDGQAYMQRQLKRIAANPKIVKYLEKFDQGKAPIFVYENAGGKVVKVSTSAMSDLLATIKTSEPIIENVLTGQQYNSLNPDVDVDGNPVDKKAGGKWGEALARNIHATIALNELNLDGRLVDFLQSRSETSGGDGKSTTQKLRYNQRARGYFSDEERGANQSIANWINEARGRDVTEIADVENRVTKATYSIPGFLEPPVVTASAADAPAAKTVTLNDMFGMLGNSDAPTDEPPAKPTTLKSSMLAGAATGTLTALGVLGLVSDPEGMMIETGAGEGAQLLARRAMRVLAPRLSPAGPAAAVSEVAAQVAGPTEIGAQSPDDESRLAYEDREAQRVAAERAVLDDPYFNVSPNVYYDDATDQYIDINTGKPRVTRETVLQMIQDQRKADPRPTAPADISTMELSMQQGAEGFDQDALAFLQSQNITGERNEPQYG